MSSKAALDKYGLKAKAKLISYATGSLHPDMFPDVPVLAIKRTLDKAGLKISDIGRFEINEAFAAVTMIAIKELGLDREKVNVNGGAIAIGHPVGASGGRLVTTLIPGLQRSDERYGLAALCIGGGEAVAAIFEKI